MIFGEKNTFAIEINLIQGDKNVFGQYCYWLNNTMIGDIEQLTLLTAILGDLEKIISLLGSRDILGIDGFSANQIIDTLIYKASEAGESYFDLNNEIINVVNINYFNTPCMDGYYVFLIEHTDFDWFLAKDIIDNKYYNHKIPKDIFYKNIKYADEWIKNSTSLVLKEGHKN